MSSLQDRVRGHKTQQLNQLENLIAVNDGGQLDIKHLKKVADVIVKNHKKIDWEALVQMDNNEIENTNIKCPYCEEIFDFESLNKNEWSVESKYLLIRCPKCLEIFKILAVN